MSSRAQQATPATVHQTRPEATPTGDRSSDSHDRVRHDNIDTDGKLTLRVNGLLHPIGRGRTLARTPVIMLVHDLHDLHDLHVRVVHAATGELLPELIIDPTRNYQPTGKARYPHRKTEKTEPCGLGLFGIS